MIKDTLRYHYFGLKELIHLMTTSDDCNKAADFLLAARLDPKDFPELCIRL